MMQLNSDFTKRAVVHGENKAWTASPMNGVDRLMLDRVGDEVARATSLVRFAPGSHFSPHEHDGGEEFLVLEGVFQDEHGDYPIGTYVRNPPGTDHKPGAEQGCTILVKLWQFDPEDRNQFSISPDDRNFAPVDGRPGVEAAPLHRDERETVRLERWPAGQNVRHSPEGGLELFVIDGGFEEKGEPFSRWSWLRLPEGAELEASSGPEGCLLWVKEGHLAGDPVSVFRPEACS